MFVFTECWFRLTAGGRAVCTRPGGVIQPAAWDARPVFDAIEDTVATARPDADARLRHLIALVALEAWRPAAKTAGLHAGQRTRLAAWARRHLHDHPTPAELAAVVGLSPDYFTRVFRQTYGLPPRAWLVRERVHAAARLLQESGQSVSKVADRFGYASVAQFSRQFKQVTGRSPSAYRR